MNIISSDESNMLIVQADMAVPYFDRRISPQNPNWSYDEGAYYAGLAFRFLSLLGRRAINESNKAREEKRPLELELSFEQVVGAAVRCRKISQRIDRSPDSTRVATILLQKFALDKIVKETFAGIATILENNPTTKDQVTLVQNS